MTDKHKGPDKPKLELVKGQDSPKDGTQDNVVQLIPSGRVGKAASGLTVKQEAFANGLANGLSNSDAYRQAYDTSGMKPNVVHTEACKLANRPDITNRMNELLQEKKARNSMLSERQTDRVWRNVWRLAEGQGIPPAVQQSALQLAAKMAGMLTDKVEVKQETVTSQSIESELLERLQRLAK